MPGPTRRDPVAAVPYELRVAAAVGWRIIVVAAVAWGVVRVLHATREIAIPTAVALLLTSLLLPVARFLRYRARLGRYGAAAVTLLGFLALVIGIIGTAGNYFVKGVQDLMGSASQGLDSLQDWLRTGPLHLGGSEINNYIEQGREWVQAHQSGLMSGAMSAGGTTASFFAGSLIALVTLLFFLADGDHIWSWMVRLLPDTVRTPVHESARRGWVTMSSYVRTQVIVAAVDAIGIALGALLLGLPLVVPLGVIVFFSSFVPVVGAFVSGALAVLVALFVKGPVVALIMLGVVLLVQQVEAHVLQPVLMSKAVDIHPWAVIVSVAVGSFLMGIVGALFAVPFAAVLNVVVLYLRGHDRFPELGVDPAGPGQPVAAVASDEAHVPPHPREVAKNTDPTED